MTNELPLSAEDRLAALEKKMAALMSNGLDLFAQEGYLQIGSNNNNGAVRFDGKSLQMNAGGGSNVGGFWFMPYLVPDPSTAALPKAYLQGRAAENGQTKLTITAVDNAPPTAPVAAGEVYVTTTGSDVGRAGMLVYVDSSLAGGGEWGEVILNRVDGEAAATLQLYQTILRLVPSQAANFPFTSDPANAIEGDIWYNTTDNKYKGIDASATKAFLMEGDVSSGPTVKVKEADETVTTSVTLQDDGEIWFAVAANEVWQFEGVLLVTAPAAADFKMTFTGPTGAVGSFGAMLNANGTGAAGDVDGGALGTSISLIMTGDGRIVRFWGGIHNGANAGNLQLQWAQDTSSGSTLVLAGSHIKYQLANV